MSIRKSKYQMIFQPVGIMEQLRTRYDEHFKKYGAYPKFIYVEPEIYKEYKDHFPVMNMWGAGGFDGGLWFRGAEVVNLKKS